MLRIILPLIVFSLFLGCKKSNDIPVPEIIEPETLEKVPIACDECDFVVSEWTTDGEALNIQPGDIICLDGSITYNNLVFANINGTPENPIIIKNCGEKVAWINPSSSAYGVKFEHSHDFKFIGDGGGGDYGIKISINGNGFFLYMEKFTSDFEIAGVEIAGNSPDGTGFAGIGLKTSPYQDCNLFSDPTRTAWIMKNITIRNNYIHETGGEGMYIGHGFYNGRVENDCPDITYSHSVQHIRIYNNILENIGYDGIQIKNADLDVAVHDNYIFNYGFRGEIAHDEGILIGDGTTGKFYNNIVIKGGGAGMFVHGMGNLDIYNNVIIDAGNYAFFASGGPNVYRFPDGYFNIFNNTFHSNGENAFVFYDGQSDIEVGGIKRLKNNIFIAPNATQFVLKGAALDSSNNVFSRDINYAKFIDFDGNDFKLEAGSPCIDAGINLSEFSISVDILDVLRPQGENYDLGAYEFTN